MDTWKTILTIVVMLMVGCTNLAPTNENSKTNVTSINTTGVLSENNKTPYQKQDNATEQIIKGCETKWPSDCSVIPDSQAVKMCEKCKELEIGEFEDICQYDWPSDCNMIPEGEQQGRAMCEKCNVIKPKNKTIISPKEQITENKTEGADFNDKTNVLVLSNIGINIDRYNSETGKAGDFVFEDTVDHYKHKLLLEFNIELGEGDNKGILPSLNYILPLDAKIFSPVSGTIEKLNYQERDNDYEIAIVPDGYPNWRVYVDHIVNVNVKQGDKIKSGEIIGNPTPWQGLNYKRGFTELQVEKISFGKNYAVCPIILLNETIRPEMEDKIKKFAQDWEKFLGKDVYDESKWVAPGCLAEFGTP